MFRNISLYIVNAHAVSSINIFSKRNIKKTLNWRRKNPAIIICKRLETICTYYKFHASNNPLDVDNYLKNIPV